MSTIKDELALILEDIGILLRPDFEEGNIAHIQELMSQLSPYRCDGGPLNQRPRLSRILTLLACGIEAKKHAD